MSGHRYLVTGAASGIGRSVALALLARGDHVVALDRAGTVPAGCLPLPCDLADPRSVDEAAAAARAGGALHGIANVAGVPGTAAPELVLAVNFLATLDEVPHRHSSARNRRSGGQHVRTRSGAGLRRASTDSDKVPFAVMMRRPTRTSGDRSRMNPTD